MSNTVEPEIYFDILHKYNVFYYKILEKILTYFLFYAIIETMILFLKIHYYD